MTLRNPVTFDSSASVFFLCVYVQGGRLKEVVLTVRVIAEVPDDTKVDSLCVNLEMKRITISEVAAGKMDRDIPSVVLAYMTEKSSLNK